MKNKLWLFGDSFTFGTGLENNTPSIRTQLFYYKNQYRGYDFGTILGKKLNLEVVNLGMEGGSNGSITESIIMHLPDITSEDVVIIGQTDPLREQLICNSEDDPKSWSQYQISPYMVEQLMDTEEENLWLKGIMDNDKMRNGIIDYYINVISPQLESRHAYARNIFSNFTKHFNSVGIRALHWSCELWDYLENIEVWTDGHPKGNIPDGHWSPNGCAGFAFILEKLIVEKQVQEVTLDLLLKGDRFLNKFHKQHTYIPFEPIDTGIIEE